MATARLDLDKGLLVVTFLPNVENGLDHTKPSSDYKHRISALTTEFPFPWLRDNCQCEKCCHPFSRERIFLFRKLDPDTQPISCKVEDEVTVLEWPDGHASPYPLQWLHSHRFEPDNMDTYLRHDEMKEFLWVAQDMRDNIMKIDYNQLMSDDGVLLEWLSTLETYGLCLVTGTPLHEGMLRKIGERVAMVKPTHYGETFSVVSKAKPSNVAYTPHTLGLHADLPSLNYSPGMQMLHCIKQVTSEGGENVYCDSFRVALDLKKENEELFNILCNTPLNFNDQGDDFIRFHMMTRKCQIECDWAGNVRKVNFNNQLRGSMLTLPIEQVKPLYRAMTRFEQMLNDAKYCIRYKMNDGDIACFHNFRVLHGREGYAMDGDRHLEGAYIDWDFMRSRRRVLQEQLAANNC